MAWWAALAALGKGLADKKQQKTSGVIDGMSSDFMNGVQRMEDMRNGLHMDDNDRKSLARMQDFGFGGF